MGEESEIALCDWIGILVVYLSNINQSAGDYYSSPNNHSTSSDCDKKKKRRLWAQNDSLNRIGVEVFFLEIDNAFYNNFFITHTFLY